MPVLGSFLRVRTGAISKREVPKVRDLREKLSTQKAKTLRDTLRELQTPSKRRHFEWAGDCLRKNQGVSRYAEGRLEKIYNARVTALELELAKADKREQKEKALKDKAKAKAKAKALKAKAAQKVKAIAKAKRAKEAKKAKKAKRAEAAKLLKKAKAKKA